MLVLGVAVLVIIACISVYFGTVMTYLTMFLFPAYDTFKAIEEKNLLEQNRLLTYWMVFGSFFALDEVLRVVLGFLPMFHLVRLAMLFCFYSKSINGAGYFYEYVQKPLFLRVAGTVDSVLVPIENALDKVGQKFQKTQ